MYTREPEGWKCLVLGQMETPVNFLMGDQVLACFGIVQSISEARHKVKGQRLSETKGLQWQALVSKDCACSDKSWMHHSTMPF